MNERLKSIKLTGLFLCLSSFILAQQPKSYTASEIQAALRKLNTVGTVMYVAAHPDDENTRLLSYLANERLFRTVYVSLTRGDGGQNLIGDQQGEELGLIRTQELLAARRIDGAEQYFTSAVDFGYSKSPEETFEKWDRNKILGDLVWAIRKFRPDVIINRFPTTGEGGHGHHTASAMLALEAFQAAADPKKFPEQLKFVKPWKANRIYLNSFIPRGQPAQDMSGQIKLDVGGYNKLLGKSYGEIAADSRSMHKSQGFGVARTRGIQYEYFKKLDGDTMTNEILGGINASWSRVENSNEIQKWVNEAIDYFNPANPEYTVPALVKLYKALDAINDSTWRVRKQADVKELIKACMGLYLEADVKQPELAPGQNTALELTINSRGFSGAKVDKITLPGKDTLPNQLLKTNESFTWQTQLHIPDNQPASVPYWLSVPQEHNRYPGERPQSGMPENEPAVTATVAITVDQTPLTFLVPVTSKFTDPVKGEIYRPLAITPLISVQSTDPLLIFSGQPSRKLTVQVSALKDSVSGVVSLSLPAKWKASPERVTFLITGARKDFTCTFEITPPDPQSVNAATIDTARILVESEGRQYRSGIRRISYDHIPPQFHLRNADVKLVRMPLTTNQLHIGYLEGAGDDVAECLVRAGYRVTNLTEDLMLNGDLSQFDAIVTGIRAYNTEERIGSYQDKLMRYVQNGGTMVVQYNTSNFLGTVKSDVGPYPFKISRDRITNEQSPVEFLVKNHPVLQKPNLITQDDFKGWVQERGIYFASETDSSYQKILAMTDPNEKPLDGSLIVAEYGSGHYVYTGLSFFRQLPAGVPGAYRLFSNLLNLGKP